MRKFGSRRRRGGRAAAGRLPAPAPPARLLPGPPAATCPPGGARREERAAATPRPPARSQPGAERSPGTPRRRRDVGIYRAGLVTGIPAPAPARCPLRARHPCPTRHPQTAPRRFVRLPLPKGTASCFTDRTESSGPFLPFPAINSVSRPPPVIYFPLSNCCRCSSSIPDSISRSVLKCCVALPLTGK